MPELEIFLLGRFQVVVDGIPVAEQRWSRKKAKVVLKLLALAPQHTLHREQLGSLLWPDMDEAAAQNNFHKVVHAARRALEPEFAKGASRFLWTQDALVSLANEQVWIDVDEFEARAPRALNTGDVSELERTLELYRADLLPEDLYEDWASLRRERLRLEYHRVLERLAGRWEALGDERAVTILNRLVASQPAHEEAHRRLMRIYAALGQRQLAIQQYRICSEALQKELDANPEPETVQLYESLLAGPVSAAVGGARPAPSTPASSESGPDARLNPPPESPPATRRWSVVMLATAALLLLVAAVLWVTFRRPPSRLDTPSIAIIPLRTIPWLGRRRGRGGRRNGRPDQQCFPPSRHSNHGPRHRLCLPWQD